MPDEWNYKAGRRFACAHRSGVGGFYGAQSSPMGSASAWYMHSRLSVAWLIGALANARQLRRGSTRFKHLIETGLSEAGAASRWDSTTDKSARPKLAGSSSGLRTPAPAVESAEPKVSARSERAARAAGEGTTCWRGWLRTPCRLSGSRQLSTKFAGDVVTLPAPQTCVAPSLEAAKTLVVSGGQWSPISHPTI